MASPERMRKIQLFLLISEILPWALVKKTMPQAMITTTTVRMAVARLEFTRSIPTLARIEVNAANIAESNASTNHRDQDLLQLRIKERDVEPLDKLYCDCVEKSNTTLVL